MNQYVPIDVTRDEKTLCVVVEAAPVIMAKVHPMNTSERMARTMMLAKTRFLDEMALPFRVSSICLSPRKRALRIGMRAMLMEIMFRATSSKAVTRPGKYR